MKTRDKNFVLLLVLMLSPAMLGWLGSLNDHLYWKDIKSIEATTLRQHQAQQGIKSLPLLSSPFFIPQASDVLTLNASDSAILNFTFEDTSSPWIRTDIYIEGPLGGILSGGSREEGSKQIRRSVKVFSGETSGLTWLRISGTTKTSDFATQYLPIKILPSNETEEAAYFLVTPTEGSDSQESESFAIKLKDPEKISEARYLIQNNQTKIVNGVIALGWGGFNVDFQSKRSWSWHFIPETISFADVTIEVCDARPSYVEDQLDQWIHNVGMYCPWGWTISRELSYQDIMTLLSVDEQKPSIKSIFTKNTNDHVVIIAETTDDFGIVNSTIRITLNDSETVTLPGHPMGNGKISLILPKSDFSRVKEITITVFDAKNQSNSKSTNLEEQSKNPLAMLPSVGPEILVLMSSISVLVIIRRHRRNELSQY